MMDGLGIKQDDFKLEASMRERGQSKIFQIFSFSP